MSVAFTLDLFSEPDALEFEGNHNQQATSLPTILDSSRMYDVVPSKEANLMESRNMGGRRYAAGSEQSIQSKVTSRRAISIVAFQRSA